MAVSTHASETRIADELYFSGHATLGAIYNTDDDVQYFRNLNQRRSDFNQFTYESDSRFGLRFSYRPHQKLGGEFQLFTRYGQSNEFETNVFSANLRYKPSADWLFRAGVIPLENFYRADTIHIGYTYLWARPPSEVYSFNLAASFKGISAQKRFYFGFDSLEVKAFGGYLGKLYSTHPDDQFNTRGSDIYGVTFEYYRGNSYISGGYTHLEISDDGLNTTKNNLFLGLTVDGTLDSDFIPLLRAALVDKPTFNYAFIGAGFEQGPWRLDATLTATESGFISFNDTYSGYFSAGYRYRRWTPFVQVAFSHNNPPSTAANSLTEFFLPPASVLNQLPPLERMIAEATAEGTGDFVSEQILQAAAEGQADQITYTFGTRYDINDSMSLKAQFSHTDSSEFPTYLWRNEAEDWDGNTNLISLVLDVTF